MKYIFVVASTTLLLGACAAQPDPVGQLQHDLDSENGLSLNGLSLNGLSLNGLSLNGLSLNGLSTTSFQGWFNQHETASSSVMRYVVKCALSSSSSLTWRNPATGTPYTWPGQLGLAPGWAGGQPATPAEQQVISACLAAHANKYGVQVPIAVEGRDATGAQIPISVGELDTYALTEGCFFGNLFTGEGVFAGAGTSLSVHETSPRACALKYAGDITPDCAPLVHIGRCADHCTSDPTHTYYTQCTYNNKMYIPLATRMLQASINICGDGICQFTESCGNGNGAGTCQKDCGKCR